MKNLSLAVIARDNEATISQVLADAAAAGCTELIVCDTGSVDRTVEVARDAGATVVHFPWIDDFAAARNHAFAACTGDWILSLDTDDRLPPGTADVIRALDPPDVDVIMGTMRSSGLAFQQNRLFRRSAGLQWVGAVHEVIYVPSGRITFFPTIIVDHLGGNPHRDGRNLRILSREYAEGDRSPRTVFYLAREHADSHNYVEAVERFTEWLAEPGNIGWERYIAQLGLADALAALGRDPAPPRFDAAQDDPSRAEAWIALGLERYERGLFTDAAPFFAAATVCVEPLTGFVDVASYGDTPWDYLATCLFAMGMVAEAEAITVGRLLPSRPDDERLLSNLAAYTQVLSMKEN